MTKTKTQIHKTTSTKAKIKKARTKQDKTKQKQSKNQHWYASIDEISTILYIGILK